MAFSPEQRAEIDRLTQEAMELPAAERERFVRDRSVDPDVMDEVLSLLRGLDDTGASRYLDQPAELPTALAGAATQASAGGGSARAVGERAGDQLGAYTLVRELGEGGFGVVWLADQKEPVRRQVALKIIKPGMDTRQVLQRFEAERQALALMEHPGIARVLDGGATEAGRPYFVMEFVAGVPITEYCDGNSLTLDARLQLFIGVCEAVQHAHQKGIIHRDIKPSNVLVTEIDSQPTAKVIDFGIAKAIDQRLTEHSLFTELGQFIGTPTYMSPEQADPHQDIDTRSDIYSLGVLLYELLTGTTPFDLRTLRGAALDEIKRIIREVEPSRPSTRLSTLGDESVMVAERRQVAVRKLSTFLRGDLDWIIMKALEKDRRRRYESATGMAADIRRHLNHEAVEASPPSMVYRFSRLVRRNRTVFAGGLLVVLSLVAGTIGTSLGLVRALRAEDRAQREAARATREAVRSGAVADLLTDALAGVGPSVARGRDTQLLEEVLQRTEERIAVELVDQPEVEAQLRSTLGQTYDELGLPWKAEENSRRALELFQRGEEPHWGGMARQYNTIGRALGSRDCREESDQALRQALATWDQLDPTDLDTAHGIGDACRDLGGSLTYQGRVAEARDLLDRALQAFITKHGGEEHADVGTVYSAMGNLERWAGNLHMARAHYEAALTVHEKLPDGHPFVGTDLYNLGGLLAEMGEVAAGENLLREAIELQQGVLGAHPKLAATYLGLGRLLALEGRYDEAAAIHEQGLRVARDVLPGTLELTKHLSGLGIVYGELARLEEALSLHLESLTVQRAVDPDPAEVARMQSDVAYAYLDLGELEQAEAMFREAIKVLRAATPDGSPELSMLMNNLGRCVGNAGRPREAIEIFEDVLQMRRKLFGSSHRQIANTLNDIGSAYGELGDFEQALQFKRDSLAMYEDLLGPDHLAVSIVRRSVGGVMRELGRLNEAEETLRSVAETYLNTFGPEHKRVLELQCDLGRTLSQQGRFAEAEPILLKVAEAWDQKGRPTDAWQTTVDALVELYQGWHAADPEADHAAARDHWETQRSQ